MINQENEINNKIYNEIINRIIELENKNENNNEYQNSIEQINSEINELKNNIYDIKEKQDKKISEVIKYTKDRVHELINKYKKHRHQDYEDEIKELVYYFIKNNFINNNKFKNNDINKIYKNDIEKINNKINNIQNDIKELNSISIVL